MATTTNGIYYPNDYDSVADIPADMKKIAESVDTKISENKTEINNIKTEQTTQNTNISNLQKDNTTNKQDITNIKAKDTEQDKYIAELEAENARLREDLNGLPKGQASGESIDLNDSAEMRFENFDIEGNSEQETREGYNLLDLTSLIGKTETKNGITYKINEDCSITVNGTPTDYTSFNLLNMSLKAGTYKFVDGLNSNNVFLQTLGDFPHTSQNDTFSLAEDGNATVYLVILAGTPTLNNTTLYPMIYEGTEDKPYEQYGATPSPDYPSEVESCGDNGSINEVICNKNLINKNLLTNYQILEDTGELLSNNTRLITPFMYLKKGTYSLSCNLSRFAYAIYNLDKSFNSFVTWKAFPNQIVLNSDCYIKIEFIINPTGSEQVSIKDITYLQLEKGNTTDYEEHQEQSYTIPTQQPMRAIGNVRDKFILKENGKWYERHYIARKIFDGTENFNLGTNANSLIYFFTDAGSIKAKSQDLLCNKLTTVTNLWNETENKNLIAIRSNLDLFNIMLSDTTINTVEKFKSWLSEQYNAGTPVYVDYILEEPLDIECTEEQSTILFDIEQNAKTYDKVTHMYSTDNVSPVIDVTYKKDIETLFANTLVEGV